VVKDVVLHESDNVLTGPALKLLLHFLGELQVYLAVNLVKVLWLPNVLFLSLVLSFDFRLVFVGKLMIDTVVKI
jgi:hypothetical protein